MSIRSLSRLYSQAYDEKTVQRFAREMREELGVNPTLGLVFVTPDYAPHWEDFCETIRLNARVPLLVGCSGQGLIGQSLEREREPGFSLLLLHLPQGEARAFSLTSTMLQDSGGPEDWHRHLGLTAAQVKGWMVLIDPYQFPAELWMQQWNEAYPQVPIFGGLAGGGQENSESWVFSDEEIVPGAVAVALTGAVKVHTVLSQGCKPIGDPLTITGVDQNVLYTLGSQPAYQVLNGAFQALTEAEKQRARGHLFAGLAVNEYVDDFKRGDFLVRNILGADPHTGAVAIAGRPRVGQTLQYQLRDPGAASEDLYDLLRSKQLELAGQEPKAVLLFTCNGRGRQLFGVPNHDALALAHYFPGVPLAGFFANGEIGPLGEKSYMHGYTASVALLTDDPG